MMSRYLWLALRMWRQQRLQGMLSMLGVMAGVAGLLTVLALGSGARQAMEEAIGRLGAGTLIVRSVADATDAKGIPAQRVRAVSRLMRRELESLVSVAVRQRNLSSASGHLESVKIIATEWHYRSAFKLKLHRGRFISELDSERAQRTCVLGWGLAGKLFPRRSPLGQKLRIGQDWFTVVGWLEPSVQQTEFERFDLAEVDRVVYVPLTTLASSSESASLNQLILRFSDEADMIRASGTVQRILEFGSDGVAFDYIIPIDLLRQKMHMQQIMQYLLAGVTVIMLLVGGVGISNVMLVNVMRRRPEIGLRRAVGASRWNIIAQFVTESTLISMLGGLAGAGLGVVAALLLSQGLGWPVTLGPGGVLTALLISALTGIMAGSYPAMQAASVEPMQALHQA